MDPTKYRAPRRNGLLDSGQESVIEQRQELIRLSSLLLDLARNLESGPGDRSDNHGKPEATDESAGDDEAVEFRVKQRTASLEANLEAARASLAELAFVNRLNSRLIDTNELVQSANSLDEAYEVLNGSLRKLFPDSAGAMFLFRSNLEVLEPASFWGMAEPSVISPTSCWALRLGRNYHVIADEGMVRCGHTPTDVNQYWCVPMLASGNLIGLLHLRPKQVPNAFWRFISDNVSSMANRLALSVADLQLKDGLRYKSIRDPLTHLCNRRHMDEVLQREIARVNREQSSISVLMIDVDHFKEINDTFGHAVADQILRSVSSLLRKQFRAVDILCRYGGDEFVVIMPSAKLEDAVKRAELFAESVRTLSIPHDKAGTRNLTVSIGVAAYPRPVLNAGRFVAAADKAMYQAKHGGRDRVVACESEQDPVSRDGRATLSHVSVGT
jgi:diguanylate cyclase (GGDEF)-like protein